MSYIELGGGSGESGVGTQFSGARQEIFSGMNEK